MKWTTLLCCAAGFTSWISADMVELLDGTRIEGKILAENENSIEIEIGTNAKGTIRRVLIIDSTEIRTWMADREGRTTKAPVNEVNRLSGSVYVNRLITEAQRKIDLKQYDEGIEEFGQAAELAGNELEKLPVDEQAEMLGVKAYALRLQLAALEGKENALQSNAKKTEERLEEMKKGYEDDLKQWEEDKKDYDRQLAEKRHVGLGTRRKDSTIDLRKQELDRREVQLTGLINRNDVFQAELQKDLRQTQMQIGLAKERVDRAEDEAKDAEKRARKR